MSHRSDALDVLLKLKQLNKSSSHALSLLSSGAAAASAAVATASSGTESDLEHARWYEWRWPEGFTPPADLLNNPEKMAILKALQAKFDDQNQETRFRERAMKSFWDVNNKTLVRYLDGE